VNVFLLRTLTLEPIPQIREHEQNSPKEHTAEKLQQISDVILIRTPHKTYNNLNILIKKAFLVFSRQLGKLLLVCSKMP